MNYVPSLLTIKIDHELTFSTIAIALTAVMMLQYLVIVRRKNGFRNITANVIGINIDKNLNWFQVKPEPLIGIIIIRILASNS